MKDDLPAVDVAKPVADDHVFLIGRPPLSEFLSFIKVHTAGGQDADQAVLGDEWRRANDRVNQLQEEEKGFADFAPRPLPAALAPLRDEVVEGDVFRNAYGLLPTEIELVELDRLVVYQKHINLAHVARLRRALPARPTPEAVFRFCFLFDDRLPPVRAARVARNAYVFSSPSNDLRFLEVTLVDGAQIEGDGIPGRLANLLGLAVGFGANFLSAIHVNDRLVLTNGSHRAYALREMGVTHAPCLVQKVSRREELEIVASSHVYRHANRYLSSPRPSVLKDYFDPELRKIVRVPRKMRQLKLTFDVESLDVPVP